MNSAVLKASGRASASMTYARSGSRAGITVHIDWVTVGLVMAILLLGLVMVTSASISIASKETGDVFFYLERQLVLSLIGCAAAAFVFCLPTKLLDRISMPLLIAACALLVIVLIPGLGYVVNGSRRWIRLLAFNFQVSELTRVFVLIWVASYAVRRSEELRGTFGGLLKPLGMLTFIGVLLLAEPDFGAATVLFATGFGLLFIAGAKLRYTIGMMLVAGAGFVALAVTSPYRLRRIMAFLDPWADYERSGFQLAQSLIAIGRGEWFGVGLGGSVQKLFYLPEAHTDFLFAVLAEELGLVGVVVTLALFIALVWRSFHIARLAQSANLQFASYLAVGFGLWLGLQAFINIGVNMGVLPTKGLTLPFMSYGRSSLIVTLGWVGLLLRVYHEAMSESRGSASARASSGSSSSTARRSPQSPSGSERAERSESSTSSSRGNAKAAAAAVGAAAVATGAAAASGRKAKKAAEVEDLDDDLDEDEEEVDLDGPADDEGDDIDDGADEDVADADDEEDDK